MCSGNDDVDKTTTAASVDDDGFAVLWKMFPRAKISARYGKCRSSIGCSFRSTAGLKKDFLIFGSEDFGTQVGFHGKLRNDEGFDGKHNQILNFVYFKKLDLFHFQSFFENSDGPPLLFHGVSPSKRQAKISEHHIHSLGVVS